MSEGNRVECTVCMNTLNKCLCSDEEIEEFERAERYYKERDAQ